MTVLHLFCGIGQWNLYARDREHKQLEKTPGLAGSDPMNIPQFPFFDNLVEKKSMESCCGKDLK